MIVKIYNFIYLIYLKLFYFNRVKIHGKVKSKSFLKLEIGRNAFLTINGNLSIQENVLIAIRKNSSLIIGKNCFFNRDCSIVSRIKVEIGDNCMFGEQVKIYDNNHQISNGQIYRDKYDVEAILIGNNCWIANDVNILKGSIIPSNTVIASMSLVNKKLDLSGIYAGIPVQYRKPI